MMESTKDLLEKAKDLSLVERAALIDALLETIDASDAEREHKWADEAQSRLEAYRSGELQAIDADTLLTKMMMSLHVKQLTNDERLDLIEEIWDSIADTDALPMTAVQREELERRLAEYLANPSDLKSWDEIKASIAKGWRSR